MLITKLGATVSMNNTPCRTAALILAAGNGSRFNKNTPKQYCILDQQTILNQLIERFARLDRIDWVQVVISPEHLDLYQTHVQPHHKLLPPCFGGPCRQHSSFNGLLALEHFSPDQVLVHDAARPWIDDQTIEAVLKELNQYAAVDIGVPVADTIKQVYDNGTVHLLPRERLYATQTPQGFSYKDILSAHREYYDLNATDDISLMVIAGHPIKTIRGTEGNRKITHPEDLPPSSKRLRIGQGIDVHKFIDQQNATYIMLGGVRVPYNRAIAAHSDGDILLHALTDAILGSIAEGDIGDHFPPSDPQWCNYDSNFFLQHAYKLLKSNHRGRILNIDINIICETPAISNYKLPIREFIAKVLQLHTSDVSIKATTCEGLGFIGRSEGILVQAHCLVELN